MWSTTPTVTVIERRRVSPPPNTVAQTSLPLTFFDLLWLNFTPFSRLLFYDLNTTKTSFTQQHLPILIKSLSIALQHYFPLAGHLITPTTYNNNTTTSTCTTKPIIRFLEGDSIEFTVAEYSSGYDTGEDDFIRLTGNQSKDLDQLSLLSPQLAPPLREQSLPDDEECQVEVSPVLAVQVTLFPNQGICLGLTSSHAVVDGSSVYNFIRAWGLISKHLSDDARPMIFENSRLFNLPCHDRSLIKDTNGSLADIYISQQMDDNYSSQSTPHAITVPADQAKRVRATFVLGQTDIEALKKLVSTKLPRLPHLSSFTVACGYLWSCMAKTHNAINDNEDDEDEHLIVAVNCRARLDPPVPETYFGNCLTICFINKSNSQLVLEGGEGIVRAAEVIGESIHEKVHESGILYGAEMWYQEFKEAKTKWKRERILGIAGSPNFYFYDIDFGWGKPRKYEFVSEKLSISGSKDGQGEMEFGLCLTENEMIAFSDIFHKGLKYL